MGEYSLEGLVGFEPTIRELQSHALPLGYRPKIKIIYKTNFTLYLFFCQCSILYYMLKMKNVDYF